MKHYDPHAPTMLRGVNSATLNREYRSATPVPGPGGIVSTRNASPVQAVYEVARQASDGNASVSVNGEALQAREARIRIKRLLGS